MSKLKIAGAAVLNKGATAPFCHRSLDEPFVQQRSLPAPGPEMFGFPSGLSFGKALGRGPSALDPLFSRPLKLQSLKPKALNFFWS